MNEQLATIAALPWGWCTGLLCASLTVLLGVARGLEPDVILVRADTAGTIAGVTLALTGSDADGPSLAASGTLKARHSCWPCLGCTRKGALRAGLFGSLLADVNAVGLEKP